MALIALEGLLALAPCVAPVAFSVSCAVNHSRKPCANGWGLFNCMANKSARNWACASRLAASGHWCATTLGLPAVNVPVLSNATVVTAYACSSAWASLIKIPCLAATPVPTIIAAGVAKPNAHGHAITKTATMLIMASSNGTPFASQNHRVAAAINNTTGTNTAATLSTVR